MKSNLPIPPMQFAEIMLLFDHDFPIEQIDTLLGSNPTEAKRQSQTRVNPITQKNNPGFWLFRTKAVSSFDSESILMEIDSFLLDHSLGLHQVIQQYSPCLILLRLRVLVRQENEYPAIRFNSEILQRFSSFNVSIDIDIENDEAYIADESS